MFLAGAMLPSSGGGILLYAVSIFSSRKNPRAPRAMPYIVRTCYTMGLRWAYHASQQDPTGRAHRFTRGRRPQDLAVTGSGLSGYVSVELSHFRRVRPRQASHRGT
jgi:hypothetical protein